MFVFLACVLQFTSASSGTIPSFEQRTLTWTAVPGASSYFIERTFGDFSGVYPAQNATVTGTEWPVWHVALADTVVRYRVTANNETCSATATFTIKADPDLVRIAQRTLIPVAGRTAGANGARFTTKLVLRGSPYSLLVCPLCPPPPPGMERAGRIVFHPAGRPASDDDPSIKYDVVDWHTQSFDDVLSDLGAAGIGWLEIVPAVGPAPAAEAWIVNDRVGTRIAATSGRDHLFTPAAADAVVTDASQRFSIGGLMLGNPGTLAVAIRHANGDITYTPPRDVPADTLIHLPLGDLAVGDAISVNVRANEVAAPSGELAYVSITDNATNDTTIILAPPNAPAGNVID